ncbi:unnamed protein product [Candida verbasci]|uniref:Hcy-binding domain-containing protein n=1 Tax=Candida verbasci TaxID=1227364 RepID=A0A9W4TXB4_9ASCO|nr:unnamed protein product [Candida verbasci]
MRNYRNLLNAKRLVIDGALGTELENLLTSSTFKPSSSPLWSGQVLIEDPQLIEKVHKSYIEAGANIIITSTYQTSYKSLKKYLNYSDDEIYKLWENAVIVANNAKSKSINTEDIIIAGSIGPYATYLANGSEYTGDYGDITKEELIDYHTPLLKFLINSEGIDIIAIETIPNFSELQVIIDLIKKYDTKQVFISINCQNSENLSDGTQLNQVSEYVSSQLSDKDENFLAFSINCTDFQLISDIIPKFQNFPLFIYPNLGYEYDEKTHLFIIKEHKSIFFSSEIKNWLKYDNVKAIGGCCSVSPVEIKQIAKLVNDFNEENK